MLVVLGTIAHFAGFSIFRFIAYIKDELLIVLGTQSSETVLPHMIEKMERLGASKSVVGLVIPTGYSFNLDGTNIYMTLATLFLAQATNTQLTLCQELGILGVAMITSKGASGVTGAGFITLAATLAIVPDIPIQSLAILLGIDRFMSECRALTNLVGNGVATVVISRWEGELDVKAARDDGASDRGRRGDGSAAGLAATIGREAGRRVRPAVGHPDSARRYEHARTRLASRVLQASLSSATTPPSPVRPGSS